MIVVIDESVGGLARTRPPEQASWLIHGILAIQRHEHAADLSSSLPPLVLGGAMLFVAIRLVDRVIPKLMAVGLVIAAGGALSNAFEALFRHSITDYIPIPPIVGTPVEIYNLGDLWIYCGSLLVVVDVIRNYRKARLQRGR